MTSITTGTKAPVLVSALSTSDPLEKAVGIAMSDNGDSSGAVSWNVSGSYKPTWAQWADNAGSTAQLVGQYPNPETDPDATHSFGTSF